MTRITRLYDEAEIEARVRALATDIIRALPDDFVVVGLLKGSFVFVADLVRELSRAGRGAQVEFLRVSSYGKGKESSGTVQIIGGLPDDVAGRPVLLVDDIVDTGRSIDYARNLLAEGGAARIWTCALLDKPSRREIDLRADFVGFEIPDLFVVGYGIDFAEDYRHLPFIGAVE